MVEPAASVAGADAAAAVVSGIGAVVERGCAGSGGGAVELDAVDHPQSSAVHPFP